MKGTVNAPGSGGNAKKLQEAADAAQKAAENAASAADAAKKAAEEAAKAAENAQKVAEEAKTAVDNIDVSGYMPKTGGVFEGIARAGNDYQPKEEYLLRNIKLSAAEEVPTVEGAIHFQYE